jgi:hypothetical protein
MVVLSMSSLIYMQEKNLHVDGVDQKNGKFCFIDVLIFGLHVDGVDIWVFGKDDFIKRHNCKELPLSTLIHSIFLYWIFRISLWPWILISIAIVFLQEMWRRDRAAWSWCTWCRPKAQEPSPEEIQWLSKLAQATTIKEARTLLMFQVLMGKHHAWQLIWSATTFSTPS